jgi:DNA-binding response OmpR family regulator
MHLTPREFDLLRYLIIHANRVLSHRELTVGADRSVRRAVN